MIEAHSNETPALKATDASSTELERETYQTPASEGNERRDSPRSPYQCEQLIAPYRGGQLPRRDLFYSVPCVDLSSSGFSFSSDEIPEFKWLVVALGRIPYRYYLAEVVNSVPIGPESQGGLRIGCRLHDRVHPE